MKKSHTGARRRRDGNARKKQTAHGLRTEADPRRSDVLEGRPPRQKMEWPGYTEEMRPRPDHGEKTYTGAGRLRGRVALITGGDSGIGRAVAVAFAREGASVAISYLNEHDDARDTLQWVRGAGVDGEAFGGDIRDREFCRELVRTTIERFGRLDILVNNAAFQLERVGIEELTPEQLERTFHTNIFATVWLSQAALEHMEAGSVILNTGSITGMEGNPGLLVYSATKGAIHAFTKSLAKSVAERGIRVNCVAPGPVWTPLIPSTLEPEHVQRFGSDTLWGRPAQPAEIAPTYVFLAASDGRYYSGEVFAPTGRAASR